MGMVDGVAVRIRDFRKKSGFTQDDIAKKLNINRVTYIGIENGHTAPNLNLLNDFCNILDISIFDLIANNESKELYNKEVFKQLYYYILKNFFLDHGIPKTKLAKLLYLSDFTYYYIYNKSITGARYIRRPYGPVAEDYLSMTDELFEDGYINIKVLDYAQLISISPVNKDFKPDFFNAKVKDIINMVCNYWKDKRTSEIVNFTHSQHTWSERRDGEYIPYPDIKFESVDNVYAPTEDKIDTFMRIAAI